MKKVFLTILLTIASVCAKSQEKVFNLDDYEVIEMPHSAYIHFLKDGKMGLAVENPAESKIEEYLPPIYDFVITVPLGTGVITLKDGKFSHYIPEEDKTLISGTSPLIYKPYPDGNDEHLYLGNKLYRSEFTEEGDNWTVDKKPFALSSGNLVLRKFDEKLLVQFENVDWTAYLMAYESVEYPGEDSISADGDVVYYPREGGIFAGVYDINKHEWFIAPNQSWIKCMDRGFLCIPHYVEVNGKETYPGFSYYDKNFNLVLDKIQEEDMTLSDTLAFLPKNSKIVDLTNEVELHYVAKKKMGVMEFRLEWYAEVDHVSPKYDLVAPQNFMGCYVTYNEGRFGLNYRADEAEYRPKLPRSAQKSIEMGESSEGTFLVIDDKYVYQLGTDEDNPDFEVWKSASLPDEFNPKPSSLVLKESHDRILVSIDNYEYPMPMMSMEYPGEDSIDWDGNVVYYEGGDEWSRFFDLKSKEYTGQKFHRLEKVGDNYIATTQKKSAYANTTMGVLDKNLNTLIPFDFNSITYENGFFLAAGDSLSTIYKSDGSQLIQPGHYGDIRYQDGYFFAQSSKVYNDWMYSEGYDDYSVAHYDQLLIDTEGNEIKCPYPGHYLLADGILMIEDTVLSYDGRQLIGYYDLKNQSLIAAPEYRELDLDQKSDIVWLNHKGKWARYQLGRGFKKIGTEEYDKLTKVVRFQDLLYCQNGEKEGLIQIDGKVLIEPKFKMGKTSYVSKDQFKLQLYSDGEKHGAFDLISKRSFLEPIYDNLIFHKGKILAIEKDGKWGAIDHTTIKEDLSFEYALEIKYEGKPWRVNDYFAMTKDKKYGIIGADGTVLVPLKYDNINFHDKFGKYKEFDSIFVVITKTPEGEKMGAYKGPKQVLPTEYTYIDFEIGKHLLLKKAIVSGNDTITKLGEYDVVNEKISLDCVYDELFNAYGEKDWVWVKKDDKYATFSMYGPQITDFIFTSVGEQMENPETKWIVSTETGTGLFDVEMNQFLVPPIYEGIKLEEDRFKVRKDGKSGLLDAYAYETILDPGYSNIILMDDLLIGYEEGLSDVMRIEQDSDDRSFVLDTLLKQVKLKQLFRREILFESNGSKFLCLLEQKDTLVKCDYDEIMLVEDGYQSDVVITKRNGRSGLIEIGDSLRIICEPKYDVLEPLYDDYYIVGNYAEWSYLDKTPSVGIINRNGNLIVPLEYHVFKTYRDWEFRKEGLPYEFNEYEGTMIEQEQ